MKIDPTLVNYLNRVSTDSNKVQNPSDLTQIDFVKALDQAMASTNQTDVASNKIGEMLAIGEIENPHDVTIAATKAELTLNYAIEVKNRVIESYKEIMRIQL